MTKKTVIGIVLVLVVILALVVVYYVSEVPNEDYSGNEELKVYSEGPMELSKIIEDIETKPYYEGYDNETLKWMKSLGEKEVFSGNGTFVIMDSHEASKIPSVYATDVIIMEKFSCDVIERHSLGNFQYSEEVLLVKNVDYIGEEIIDLGLA